MSVENEKKKVPIFDELFDNQNFDPIQYINEKFPDEKSLTNLDSEIEILQEELNRYNQDIVQAIHEHALLNTDLKNQIQQANTTTREVIQEIQVIKDKASKSENLVYDMCKDIKSLDTAKRNLTYTITSLKKYIMQMTAVEQLKNAHQKRNYIEVNNLIQAYDELAVYFQSYQNVQQIRDLFREKEDIIVKLKQQILEDFAAYGRQATTLKADAMQAACNVIETLGQNFKNDVVQKICNMILDGYVSTFQQQENNNMDKYERRFSWISRTIKEYDTRWEGVFPNYWGMLCYIYNEFCGMTRIQLTQILEENGQDNDVKVLMKSLQLTIAFEQKITKDLEKRYSLYLQKDKELQEEEQKNNPEIVELQQKKGQYMISYLPKFKGSISDSFQNYLRPYVKQEQTDIEDYMRKNIQIFNFQKLINNFQYYSYQFSHIFKCLQEDQIDPNFDQKVYNSSLFMFNYIKSLIKRASGYSRSQVMLDIFKVIQKALKIYSDEITQIIFREDRNKSKSEQNFIQNICYCINTSEYCKETLSGLEETIQQNMDQPFSDSVDLMNEEELFVQVINKGIEVLLNHVGSNIEGYFSQIARDLNYGQIDDNDNVDNADLVNQIKRQLNTHVSQIKELISEVYLIFYLNKLVVLVNKKFWDNIQKFKKFTENTLPIFMVDCTELENCLTQLGKMDNESKTMVSYTNFVSKTFHKTKNILKLIAMEAKEFKDNFLKFYPEASVSDLEKLLPVKGLKRQDVSDLLKVLQK